MLYGARDRTLGGEGILAVERAAELGLDGVELNALTWPPDGPLWRDDERRRIHVAAAESGLRIPSLGFGILNQGGLTGDETQQQRARRTIEDGCRVARQLGASVVMLQHFGANRIDSEQKISQVIAGVRAILPTAIENGVTLALEDSLDARANLRILDEVGSPNLKVYYDVCNTWSEGHDVPADIALLGDRIAQVHFKDRRPDGTACHLGEGIVDVAACADALRAIGYSGWVLLETPADDDPLGNARRNLAFLRRYV
jgi:L-ribulose-5-phosphate 3-epimerase